MIDPEAASSPDQASRSESGPPRPSPDPGGPLLVDAEVGAVVASGLLPTTPLGASVRARFAFEHVWSVEAYSLGFLPVATAAARGASADFSAVLGGLTACHLAFESGGGNRFDLCAGFEAGALGAEPHGFDISHSRTTPTLDAVAQGHFLASLGGRFALRLGAAIGVPLVRSRFEYTDPTAAQQLLYERPPVAATGELAFVVRLR
jgi:hypothetical protein